MNSAWMLDLMVALLAFGMVCLAMWAMITLDRR